MDTWEGILGACTHHYISSSLLEGVHDLFKRGEEGRGPSSEGGTLGGRRMSAATPCRPGQTPKRRPRVWVQVPFGLGAAIFNRGNKTSGLARGRRAGGRHICMFKGHRGVWYGVSIYVGVPEDETVSLRINVLI